MNQVQGAQSSMYRNFHLNSEKLFKHLCKKIVIVTDAFTKSIIMNLKTDISPAGIDAHSDEMKNNLEIF